MANLKHIALVIEMPSFFTKLPDELAILDTSAVIILFCWCFTGKQRFQKRFQNFQFTWRSPPVKQIFLRKFQHAHFIWEKIFNNMPFLTSWCRAHQNMEFLGGKTMAFSKAPRPKGFLERKPNLSFRCPQAMHLIFT